ncbi:hypothetical protein MRX96_009280 [Rhipicephalus microplus]|uniref:Uncharacterized protein n=1 Tax=Rhipicephalus microplus TaxID=6941 RepID=A0A9J6EM66_RHIMP|nr:hypothetical protein HPB51_004385 [Rhipicephalus microplus]
MHGYYLGYLRTSGGQLKMFEVIVGLVQLFYLMAVNYDRNHDWYVLRMDLLIMLMGTFTAVFAASFVLLTVILGSTEVPFSLLYRLLYLSLCVVMIPATAVFLKETRIHSSTRELIVSATVSVCFCIGLLGNFVLAYKPTIFETKVTQRVPREHKHEGGGSGH